MAFTTTKPVLMLEGGLGDSASTISYAPVCAGVNTQGALQTASSGMENAGYVFTSTGDASLPTWQAPISTELGITAVTTTPYVVLDDDEFLNVDTGIGAISIELPNAPTTGRVIYIKDGDGSALTNNITVTTVGGVVTIDGATSVVMNSDYQSLSVIFNGTAYLIF